MSARPPPTTPDALLQQALALHRAGQLAPARSIYARLLVAFPHNLVVPRLLGPLECQMGNFERGAALLQRCADADPTLADVHCNLGSALRELKRHTDAIASFERALALQPGYVDAHFNKGLTLLALADAAAALACFERVLALDPARADAHSYRGYALGLLARAAEALDACDRAVARQPALAHAWNHRGLALVGLARHADAIAAFDRALALDPRSAQTLVNRANALRVLQRLPAALADCDAAIAADPSLAEAHNARGLVLYELWRDEEAVASFECAIAAAPRSIDAYVNRGLALKTLRRFALAQASYEAAHALDPHSGAALWNLALLKLLQGDFREGWRLYENRSAARSHPQLDPRKRWRGESDPAGKTILLQHEQGFGDTMQFCRFATLLAGRGARVLLRVQPALVELMAGVAGVDRALPSDAAADDDLECPLLSLPLALGTTVDTIPSEVPYLRCDPARSARWRDRLGPRRRPRIGLTWAAGFHADHPEARGINQRRDIALTALAPLRADADFFSLQKGDEAVQELERLRAERWDGPAIVDHTDALHDFADTAALIDELDLVISVDTAVAHLAAALGKPTWILLRHDACWRWLLDRDDSPWYPSARLYRQPAPRDWASVVTRVAQDLREFVRQRGH